MWSGISTALPPRSLPTARTGALSAKTKVEPVSLGRPALFDTGVWTWVRDRRFPELSSWFNAQVSDGLVLVCDVVVLELIRLTPNESRAQEVAGLLEAFEMVEMGAGLWQRARELQSLLSASGDHRRVPPIDLLIGAAAEQAGVPLVHYDRDYERLAKVSALQHHWLVPDGALAA
jgi:predicted nucleic acid-binding protein